MPPSPDTPDGAAIMVKLDDLLHERRMTLTELAERVGMTLANLSILKTGKAKPVEQQSQQALLPEHHSNVRGADYYH